MIKLNLPEYQLKIKKADSKNYIFDITRKKYILLTPEEYVRQRFIHFLIIEKKYPKGLITTEKSLEVNKLKKRADIVVYDRNGTALLIVECKATNVKIGQKTIDQLARYNIKFNAEYLIATNGLSHYCYKRDADSNYAFLKKIPYYDEIKPL